MDPELKPELSHVQERSSVRAAAPAAMPDAAAAKAHADGLVRAQRYADAAVAYGAIIDAGLGTCEIENNVGSVYRIAGGPQHAERHYRRALALNPDFVPALSNLGTLLLERGAEEEGAATLRRAHALAPADVSTALNLARYLLGKNDTGGAAAVYGGIADRADTIEGGYLVRGHLRRLRRDFAGARDDYLRAHRAAPANADILAALATTCGELGEAADSLAWARQAFEMRPNEEVTTLALAAALLGTNKIGEAINFAQAAVKARPSSLTALMLLAKAWTAAGNKRRSFETWRQVIKRDPKSVVALNNIAQILLTLRRPERAKSLLRKAQALAPGDAVVNANLASAHFDLGEFAAARRFAVHAMRLDRNSDPVRMNYARTLQIFGRHVAARGHFKKILRRDPRNLDAFYALAQNAPRDVDDHLIESVEGRLRDAGLDAERRGLGHMGLAAVYDYRGQADSAFKHALAGKAHEAASYEPERFGRFVDDSIATFTERFFADRREFGARDAVPIFIVGLPRSGTTLVEQIIASHPRVKGGGELTALNAVAEAVADYATGGLRYPRALARIGEPAVLRLAHQYLKAIKPLKGAAARVTDKMPLNSLRVGLIRLLLPEAKIVYCTRDVRDTFISNLLMKYRSPIPFTCRPDWFAAFYRDYERLRRHWQQTVPPGAIHWLSYEGLVHSFEEQARALIDFCGLPWDDQCLAFHRNRGPIVTGSNVQVRQRIYQSSVGRGERYAHLLGELASVESPDSRVEGSDG